MSIKPSAGAQAPAPTPDMSASERLQIMVRTDRGSMTVWSPAEVRKALDAFRAEVLAEAADLLSEIGTPITGQRTEHERGVMYASERLRSMAASPPVTAPTPAEARAEQAAEIDRLRAELDGAKADLDHLHWTAMPSLRREIQHHQDGKKRWRDRAEKAEAELKQGEAPQPPSRFSATPAQVDDYLRRILCEDTLLNYQWVIGNRAVEEAAKDIRMESHTPLMNGLYRNGMVFAADHIDPLKGGGHYPSVLLCGKHNGFGPCPGAPRCTPRDDDPKAGA